MHVQLDLPQIIIIASLLSLVILMIIVSIIGLRKQNMKLKATINNLQDYNKTLQDMYDGVRGFKHDFSNFIQALEGYAQTKDVKGIEAMCKSACKECQTINNLGALNPKVINDSAIYSLITSKFYLAQKENVTMNIDVNFDLKKLEIDTYKLCKVLGILLDNAIEASKNCEDKLVNVRFYCDKDLVSKFIVVENTYEDKNIDVVKIFEKGYSTKQEENDQHGLGLWNVMKMIKSDSKIKLTTEKGKLFVQRLEIY